MDPNRQDIYESNQSKFRPTPHADGGRGGSGGGFFDIFRQSKRAAFVFRLIVLAFMIFISLFIVEESRNRRVRERGTFQDYRPGKAVTLRTESVFSLGDDFESELIMDEMADMEPTPISAASGEIEMNTHWVKQAAMHLIKAERAYAIEEWAEAIIHYNNALKILPDLKGVDARLGLCYMRVKDYDSSSEAFGKVSEEDMPSYRVLNNLGVSRLASKDFNAAEQNFLKVLEIEPNYAPALHNIALLYYRTEMYAESADYFQRYFALKEVDLNAMQIYTDALIKLERWEEAADVLRRSGREMPRAAPIFMSLAYVLSNLGEYDEAMANLERGVALLDRPKAMSMVAAPEYNALRNRQDFKELVDRITAE
jgi:tetratricopeptide (TPR) repeat protein